jgi:hypothetical protein
LNFDILFGLQFFAIVDQQRADVNVLVESVLSEFLFFGLSHSFVFFVLLLSLFFKLLIFFIVFLLSNNSFLFFFEPVDSLDEFLLFLEVDFILIELLVQGSQFFIDFFNGLVDFFLLSVNQRLDLLLFFLSHR